MRFREFEQVVVARHEHVCVSRAGERYEVVVAGVVRDEPLSRWRIFDPDAEFAESSDDLAGLTRLEA